MQVYRRKVTYAGAEQWHGDTSHPLISTTAGNATVHGKQGFVQIYPGDWMVEEPDGTGVYPVNPETFAELYEPV